MSKTNHARVGEALDTLNKGLRPFVERELRAAFKDTWEQTVSAILRKDGGAVKSATGGEINWDTQNLLLIMWETWSGVFRNTLGHTERAIVSELREVRNRWAHQTALMNNGAANCVNRPWRLLKALP